MNIHEIQFWKIYVFEKSQICQKFAIDIPYICQNVEFEPFWNNHYYNFNKHR